MKKARQQGKHRNKAYVLAFAAFMVVVALYGTTAPSWKHAQLQRALADGDGDTVSALVRSGLNPHTDVCVAYNRPALANWFPFTLLPENALPRTCSGTAPLIVVAAALRPPDGPKIVGKLLRRNVSATTTDTWGQSALECAIEVGDEQTADLLLQHGANPNACGDDGMTALQAAFNANWDNTNAPFIRLLLRKGAFLCHKNKKGQMPLDSVWIVNQFRHPQSLEEQLADEIASHGPPPP